MRRGAQNFVERMPIDLQRSVPRKEAGDLILAHAQDFGVDEGARFIELVTEESSFLGQFKARRGSGILGQLFR